VAPSVSLSAHSGAGLEALRVALDELIFGARRPRATLALNDRHLRALQDARAALNRALEIPASAPELLALELRTALDALGSIVGAMSPDDLLGTIFSTFCIGK
jgi:tRNA modification GTPase